MFASSGLKNEEGADVSVRVRGTVVTSDPLYTVDLALAGLGIAYVFEPLVRAQLREGRLRWLMPEASVEQPGLFLYFPRGASEAPKLRAFIDAVRDVFNAGSRPAGEPARPSPSSIRNRSSCPLRDLADGLGSAATAENRFRPTTGYAAARFAQQRHGGGHGG